MFMCVFIADIDNNEPILIHNAFLIHFILFHFFVIVRLTIVFFFQQKLHNNMIAPNQIMPKHCLFWKFSFINEGLYPVRRTCKLHVTEANYFEIINFKI